MSTPIYQIKQFKKTDEVFLTNMTTTSQLTLDYKLSRLREKILKKHQQKKFLKYNM